MLILCGWLRKTAVLLHFVKGLLHGVTIFDGLGKLFWRGTTDKPHG
jgi:hypothetical protein